MNHYFALAVLLSGIFGAQEAAGPEAVPVEKEPLHQTIFKNESVLVIRLNLPAGERTLYHTHIHDRVAIEFTSTSIAQQKIGENEGRSTATKPGGFSALSIGDSPFTHRVHNVGAAPYVVMDVEILQSPQGAARPAAATIAADNPSARVYNWVLAPGASSAMHSHARPYLIVAATAFNLKMTAPDGKTFTHELKAGDIHWVDAKVTHSLGNAGTVEGQILEVELK